MSLKMMLITVSKINDEVQGRKLGPTEEEKKRLPYIKKSRLVKAVLHNFIANIDNSFNYNNGSTYLGVRLD